MTLIPQAISYATLANVPVIHGIYSAILPGAGYVIFGTSMHLGLGPVALVSILTGQLVLNYGIKPGSQEAVDFTGEAALAVGTIFCVLSIFNLGDLITYISHPVMSGFTTGAAMSIGLSQLKNGFGFTNAVPQTGQEGYEYNYQVMKWFVDNWSGTYTEATAPSVPKGSGIVSVGRSYQNFWAVEICFAIFLPLLLTQMLRNTFPNTPERAKSVLFNIWNIVSSLFSFGALVISAHIAWSYKNERDYSKGSSDQYYQWSLKTVGTIPSGLNFFHAPNLKWNFGKLIIDVIPLALVSFMESYSVAHRISTQRNELHFLNASQELFGNGVANFMSAVSSGYPVSGSFSRSALNTASGSRTAMSKAFTVSILVLTVAVFTPYVYYVPNAALTAIIWASIYNLWKFSDLWHAWKHSKKDFLVLLTTMTIVFVFNTGLGLAVGIGLSFLILLTESQLSTLHAPVVRTISSSDAIIIDKREELYTAPILMCGSGSKIELIQIPTDLNFMTIHRVASAILKFLYTRSDYGLAPTTPGNLKSDALFYTITSTVDRFLTLPGRGKEYADELPAAIVLDLVGVKIIDLTALIRLEESVKFARKKKVKMVFFNVDDIIARSLSKFGIVNDVSSENVNLDQFLAKATNIGSLLGQDKRVGFAAADSVGSQDDADVEKELGKAGN
eukprot:gene20825-26993_t